MKNKLSLVILLLWCTFSMSQESFDPDYIKEQTPTSPESASLGNYGNIANNPYNGKANVSINLHSLNFEGLNIPITLSYDTGGIKVNTESSWVGLNWSLSGAASITRRVYGNDDLNEGRIVNHVGDISARVFSKVELNNDNGQVSLDYSDVENIHSNQSTSGSPNNNPDLSADIYSVSVFGENYSFYLKKRSGVSNFIEGHIFNDKFATITYDLLNQSFLLKDSRGFSFVFSSKNYTATATSTASTTGITSDSQSVIKEHTLSGLRDNRNHSENTVVSSWNLDRINSPLGNSLYFNYQEGAYFTAPQYSSVHKMSYEDDNHIGENEIAQAYNSISPKFRSSMSIIHAQYLTSIVGDFGSVEFQSSPDRKDLLTGNDLKNSFPSKFGASFSYVTRTGSTTNTLWHTHGTHVNTASNNPNDYSLLARKLDGIKVKNSNNKIVKDIAFTHGYYNSDKIGNVDEALYLRLRLNDVQINNNIYKFEYSSSNLPHKMTFDKDFWGFYNGANNDNNIPSIGRFMVSQSPYFTYDPPYKLHSYSGSDQIPYGPEDLDQIYSIGEYFYELKGADLSSNFNYGNRGNLSKITYPTGGYTIMEYDANKAFVPATLPYVVEDVYSNSLNMRWTSLRNEDNYNFTYLHLKYADDPNYSLFNQRYDPTNGVEGRAINPNGPIFTVEYMSAVKADGFLSTFYINDNELASNEIVPKYYVQNVNHPEITYTLFNYGDWYNSPPGDPTFAQRVVVIPPGTYRLKDAGTPIGASGVALLNENSGTGDFSLIEGTIDGIDGFAGAEIFEVGGARVKSISNFDNSGSFVNKKEYAYSLAGSEFNINTNSAISSGKLMDNLIYHSKLGFYSYVPIFRSAGGQDVLNTEFGSNNLVGQSLSAQGSHVGYSEVTEYSLGKENNILGAVKRKYSNKSNEYHKDSASRVYDASLDYSQNSLISQSMLTSWENSIVLNLPLKVSNDYSNGQVLKEEWYSCSGALTNDITNIYSDLAINTSSDFNASFWFFPYYGDYNTDLVAISNYHWFRLHQTYYTYPMPNYLAHESLLTSSISKKYSEQGHLPSVVNYIDYDDKGNITSQYQEDSEGGERGSVYHYPYSSDVSSNYGSPILRSNQIYSQIIKTESYNNSQLIEQSALNFVANESTNGHPRVDKILKSKGNASLTERKSFERYNNSGKLVQSRLPSGTIISYLWGYNEQYVVASAVNASYSELLPFKTQIDQLTALDDDSCGYNGSCNENNLLTSLNALRTTLADAQVSLYTYNPLVGLTSKTTPNGVTTYYNYDNVGRLNEIIDQDGKLISKTDYNITNDLIEALGSDALGILDCIEDYNGASNVPITGDSNGNNIPVDIILENPEDPNDVPITVGNESDIPFSGSSDSEGSNLVPNSHNTNNEFKKENVALRTNSSTPINYNDTKIVSDGIVNNYYKYEPLRLDIGISDTKGDGNIINYFYKAMPFGGSGDVEYRWKVRGQKFSNFSASNEWAYTFDCANESVRGLQVICEIRDKILGITYREEIKHIVLCNN